MKLNKKEIIALIIVVLIILAGIVIVSIVGFNKELRFRESQQIDLYIGQELNVKNVKSIVDEILGKNNMVQAVEIYKDMVTIRATSINDEQRNQIVEKLKEVYEFEQVAEEVEIKVVPETKTFDIFKKYILPFIIAEVLVLIYMIIRYYKRGILRTVIFTVGIPIISIVTFISLIAITRIPVGRFTSGFVVLIYILSILYSIYKIENNK